MPLRPVSPVRGNRTPEQAARHLGLPVATVRKLMRGPLEFFVIQGREYISSDAIEAYARRAAQS